MAKQLYYEDVRVGDEVPTLVKHPTPKQLVMWAGASGDYNPIHYDKDFALSQGLPGIIVHGPLVASFITQLITDWIGELGTIRRLSTTNRRMLMAKEDLFCKGKVTRKYDEKGEHYLECEVWAENSKGEKCVPGTALVTLPARAN